MKILFWCPPWPVNGDPNFFRNAVRKHLIPQANSLSRIVDKVDFVLPEFLKSEALKLDPDIRSVVLPFNFGLDFGLPSSISYTKLYKGITLDFEDAITSCLQVYLGDKYDAILLWETPVPFLQSMFPSAVIVSQMPGIFSRPPYPHTVIFDPVGLYKSGVFHLHAKEIQQGSGIDRAGLELAHSFCSEVQRSVSFLQPVGAEKNVLSGNWQKRELIPLQISGQYAFRGDTPYENQLEFLYDVLSNTDSETALIATQYMTPHVKENPLNGDVAAAIRERFPNFFYSPELEKIDSVSQFMLPFVDGVVCASSSLGIQAMAWHRTLRVFGPTYLANYDTYVNNVGDVTWEERCNNTIATILTRHQPLASAVTQDGPFLLGALEDIISRKGAGKSGLDLLPNFEEIDRGYSRRLMEGFRTGRAARLLSKENPFWTANHRIQKRFRTQLDAPEIMAISFDVFDTLIRRPFERPADLFCFLDAKALQLTNGIATDFGRIRTMCEVETRNRFLKIKEEITLDDIYDTVQDYYDLTKDQTESLKSAEIEIEIAAARERPFGRNLYDIARASGRPIYLISDMYLSSDVIKRMLKKAGYDDYCELFVSSEYQCRKHNGNLFKVFLGWSGLAPQKLLHVGDNKHSDINMSEKHGIRAFRWSKATDFMEQNQIYKKIYSRHLGAGERARSAIVGVTALGLYDAPVPAESFSSLSGGQVENLGYAVLGPIITGYVTWLGREARRDGITDLYFMAREGWVLKEAFNILHDSDERLPKGKYLYGSRRALRLAACHNVGDIIALTTVPYNPGVSLDKLLHGRFGINLSQNQIDLLADQGITHPYLPLSRSFADRSLLRRVCKILASDILENARNERDAYCQYLAETGFHDARKPAIVDIGWSANIQGILGDLTNRRITGYYYATLQNSEIWLHRGDHHRCYAGQCLSSRISTSVVVRNRHLMEFLLCHVEQSLVAMRKTDSAIQPVFRSEPDHAVRRKFIEALHMGALQFVRKYHADFSHFADQIYIDPALAESAMKQFVESPVGIDAKLLLNQSFEDLVGGIPKKYIVSPSSSNHVKESVWEVGAKAAHTSTVPAKVKSKRHLEQAIVEAFLSGPKRNKYFRDRAGFFEDSQSSLLRFYYSITADKK